MKDETLDFICLGINLLVMISYIYIGNIQAAGGWVVASFLMLRIIMKKY